MVKPVHMVHRLLQTRKIILVVLAGVVERNMCVTLDREMNLKAPFSWSRNVLCRVYL